MYAVHRLNFRLIGKLVQLAMPAALVLLVITMFQGTEMGGANASRWVRIPILGMSFQTSACFVSAVDLARQVVFKV